MIIKTLLENLPPLHSIGWILLDALVLGVVVWCVICFIAALFYPGN